MSTSKMIDVNTLERAWTREQAVKIADEIGVDVFVLMKCEELVKRLSYAFLVKNFNDKDMVDSLLAILNDIAAYEAMRDGYREDKGESDDV